MGLFHRGRKIVLLARIVRGVIQMTLLSRYWKLYVFTGLSWMVKHDEMCAESSRLCVNLLGIVGGLLGCK